VESHYEGTWAESDVKNAVTVKILRKIDTNFRMKVKHRVIRKIFKFILFL
jgi:hypothetical protein